MRPDSRLSPARRLAAASALLLASVAVVHAAPDPASPEPPNVPFTPAIDGEQFAARAAILASDGLEGRESGMPGGTATEDLVAEELERCGYSPAGESGTGFQTVPMPWRPVLVTGSSLAVLRDGADARRASPSEGAVPFSFSASGRAEGEVAFAGYGLSDPASGYDDYAGLDVKGRIVLVLRHGPREDVKESPWFLRARDAERMKAMSFEAKARRAAELGAAGIVFVNDRHHKDEGLPATSPGAALTIAAFAVPRALANEILAPTGQELADLEKAIDGDMKPHSRLVPGVRVALEAAFGEARARNVLFARKGADPALADEVVVLSAHTDHVGRGWFGSAAGAGGEVHNGADDNASGTAAMLEAAEALAAGPPLRRTVLVAGWCGEEKGLVGSAWWCDHPTVEIPRVVANVNLDMVGRYRDGSDSEFGLFAVGLATGSTFARHAEAAREGSGLRITPSWEAWEQSDHFSLYRKKVPVVFLHTGLHPDYHRPGDDWWKLDAPNAARVASFAAALVRRIADDDARAEFVPKPPRAVLGAMLGDAPNAGGAVLRQVMPGLAAAAAGLKAGDVVVRVGDRPITRGADLSQALGERKPGDEVDVTFRRDGKDATVRVKLSER